MAFLGIPDHRRISKLHGINERLGNKSTPRNHPLQLVAETARLSTAVTLILQLFCLYSLLNHCSCFVGRIVSKVSTEAGNFVPIALRIPQTLLFYVLWRAERWSR